MSHSVVALVWNGCEHCEQFKKDMETDGSLKNVISLCEKNDVTCNHLCNHPYPTPGTEAPNCPFRNDRAVDGFPTFKCIANDLVMSGYENIDKVKAFVNKCKSPG
jgi:hypothetical protein